MPSSKPTVSSEPVLLLDTSLVTEPDRKRAGDRNSEFSKVSKQPSSTNTVKEARKEEGRLLNESKEGPTDFEPEEVNHGSGDELLSSMEDGEAERETVRVVVEEGEGFKGKMRKQKTLEKGRTGKSSTSCKT